MALYASELRKAVTHPLVLLGAVGSFVCVPAVAVALTGPEGLLRALQLGQIFAVLIAMGAVGQEYESSSLRTSLLCSPQRLRLLSVKLTALATIVVGMAVGSMAIGSLALRVSAGEFGLPGPRSSLLAVFSWAGMSFIGAALAILGRSPVLPGAVLIPLTLGLSQAFAAFLPAARFLPDQATFAVFVPEAKNVVDPTVGTLVLLAWVLALVIPAGHLFNSRDVR